jgi:Arc/MetJ-type ribon-helix-helix transcriptional regulator
MSVTVTPETEAKIRRCIESGHHPDEDSAISSAFQALEEQYEAKVAKLRELVRAGFESLSLGELTDQLWDKIDRLADERIKRGEPPNRHVCP